ncbi:MAG: N-acetylmuramoyl-L-alanine amidase [Phycisphaeraceae bacterium]
MPDRRTITVLVALVIAMTIASGMLLGLEPRPKTANAGNPLSLNVTVGRAADLSEMVLATTPLPTATRWNTIAIHFSGSAYGSARSLDELHQRMGLEGLGYHLVIDNGNGGRDGQLEIGHRWAQQLAGVSTSRAAVAPITPAAIDICLIGDGVRHRPTDAQMRQLVQVVQTLQRQCRIPADHVLLYTDARTGRGQLFPLAWFRQQLLDQ